ncbi:N-6 DNA methylase [Paenibacillus barcinonensis]|uniref:Helicase-like protein n=1 Tax=Paenibacillus barcinonensis TaxID=198119 RepID=A0A2V4W8G8_PAEBA|nr:N-6 DNA methylase [Paenibacillus barcinonensis]PYE51613.1 helicase-like protein [Paenibacillus barcinonensis]QKS55979.1 N-6 DNA methylase [Paenibacillus barcinonensis]
MAYQIKNITVPSNKRENINDKIIHLIDNGLTEKYGITEQNIFDTYTGNGGLHGLNFSDYHNFHEYTEAKKDLEVGQFFTPHLLSKFLIDCLKPSRDDLFADITCGMGNFFNWLPNHNNVYGNELDIKAFKVAKHLYPDVNMSHDDIRNYEPQIKFDIVLGNPPFNLKWSYNNVEYLSQLYYCLKSYELLKPSGILALIVPVSFIVDDFSDAGMIKTLNEKFNFIYQTELPSNSFENVGVNNFRTKIVFFQKKSQYISNNRPYESTISSIQNISETTSDCIYKSYIEPIVKEKEKIKQKVLLESLRSGSDDSNYQDEVKKLLFDIKRNSKIRNKYAKCLEKVNQLAKQRQPESMKYDEWVKVRLTPNKVLSYLKRIIKNQHIKEMDEIELVKTASGLKYKAYSHKTKLQLSKMEKVKEASFVDMILNEDYPFEERKFKKLQQRKINAYKKQAEPFKTMSQDKYISKWLNEYELNDSLNDRVIKFNSIQCDDMGRMLQKRYGLLQWDCGGGKSLAAVAYSQYHLQHNNVRNMFIVAPAIAITGTFETILTSYGIPFVKVDSLQSISSIKPSDIVLVTFNMVTKYQRQIKKFIRLSGRKIGLVLDESDSIATMTSKRTKATLNVFKNAKYKLLTTGTSVRNSIGEAFPQFQLLYNSSVNFLNRCEEIYVEDKKTKELKTELNVHYLKPYPQYHKGQKLFKESHIPEKITVFGVSQATQHIYNSDVLKALIDSTIITRTFEEITGRSIANIFQDTCSFNNHEYDLYKKIIEEFYEMARSVNRTGNSRKDRMLEILQQLNMLIRSCSAPHLFKEYRGSGYSSKFKNVFNKLEKWNNEPVVIGCRFKKTVYSYARHIKEIFPERKLFIVTGEDMSLKQRKEMIIEMKKCINPIMVCTQQSMSSSISINYVNKIIVPELAWNGASLHQFTARFVRFDSESDNKEIHYITYENSIESNLLKLILSKEKLNLFMKNDDVNDDELYERFGVDFDILNMVMTKEKDQHGYTRLKWGQQEVI